MRKIILTSLLSVSVAVWLFIGAGDRIGRVFLSAGFPAAAVSMMNDPAWKGAALYKAEQWDAAAASFRLSHAPASAYNLGNALAQSGQYASAIEAYDDALARDPDDEDAQANRGLVAALMKRESRLEDSSASGSANAAVTKQDARRNKGEDASDAPLTGPEGRAGGTEVKSLHGGGGSPLASRGGSEPNSEDGSDAAHGAASSNSGGHGDLKSSMPATLLESGARFAKAIDASAAYPDVAWLQTLPDEAGRFLKLRLAFEHDQRVNAGNAPPITGDPW